MGELHADLHKQNQLHHPGKNKEHRYYLYIVAERRKWKNHYDGATKYFLETKGPQEVFWPWKGIYLYLPP